jgi:hypothetical protein
MASGGYNLVIVTKDPTLGSDLGPVFPRLADDGSPVLGQGEQVLWQGVLNVSALRQISDNLSLKTVWRFPVGADVWVTDQRVVYCCKKFEAGEWKTAFFEETGPLVAAVESAKAVAHRVGKMAVGQVWYEWPAQFLLLRNRTWLGSKAATLGVTCVDPWDDALVRLLLSDRNEAKVAEVARILIRAIAEQRLVSPLTEDARAALAAQSQNPVTQSGEHPFGTSDNSRDPFTGVAYGKAMFFTLAGATKIGEVPANRQFG